MQARLGVPPAAPAPHPDAEETQCVVCFDAPKDHAIVPCGHVCVCEACAEQLTKTRTPMCPVCREPIQQTMLLIAEAWNEMNNLDKSKGRESFALLFRAQRPNLHALGGEQLPACIGGGAWLGVCTIPQGAQLTAAWRRAVRAWRWHCPAAPTGVVASLSSGALCRPVDTYTTHRASSAWAAGACDAAAARRRPRRRPAAAARGASRG